MGPDDFVPAQRKHVVRAEGGYYTGVPPPLPPHLVFEGEFALRLSAADRAVGELAGVGRSLLNTQLLTHALIRREAVLSSRIEGTRATLSDLVLYELDQPASRIRLRRRPRGLQLGCCDGTRPRPRPQTAAEPFAAA